MTTRTAISRIMKTRVIWLTHPPRIVIFVRIVFSTSHPLTQVTIMRTWKAVSYNDIHHVSPFPNYSVGKLLRLGLVPFKDARRLQTRGLHSDLLYCHFVLISTVCGLVRDSLDLSNPSSSSSWRDLFQLRAIRRNAHAFTCWSTKYFLIPVIIVHCGYHIIVKIFQRSSHSPHNNAADEVSMSQV